LFLPSKSVLVQLDAGWLEILLAMRLHVWSTTTVHALTTLPHPSLDVNPTPPYLIDTDNVYLS
jgi:hypothetical protein